LWAPRGIRTPRSTITMDTFVDLGERTEMTRHVAGRAGGAEVYDGSSTMFDKLADFLAV
jgi:hypothetical protein